MNLTALSEILGAKNREYEIAHSRVLRSLSLDQDSTTVGSYVTLVKNDVAEWIRLTPMNNTKPKTALLYLLEKCDAIREELGAEECEEVASALRTEWKRLRKEYTSTAPSNKRASSAPNQTNIDDDASSTRGSGSNIDTRVSEQDAYIISLQTRLKLLQGIIEDIVKPGLSDAEKLQAVVSRTLFFTDVETSEDDSA